MKFDRSGCSLSLKIWSGTSQSQTHVGWMVLARYDDKNWDYKEIEIQLIYTVNEIASSILTRGETAILRSHCAILKTIPPQKTSVMVAIKDMPKAN